MRSQVACVWQNRTERSKTKQKTVKSFQTKSIMIKINGSQNSTLQQQSEWTCKERDLLKQKKIILYY